MCKQCLGLYKIEMLWLKREKREGGREKEGGIEREKRTEMGESRRKGMRERESL